MKNYDITEIDESVKSYMESLKGFKSLTKKEEHELLNAYKKHNDVAARNKLITANLKYACKLASDYRGRGIPFSDLISEANDGLIHAIDEFDIKKDVKLFSYAKWWIMQKMQYAIDKKNRMHSDELPTEHDTQTLNDDDGVLTEELITDEQFIDSEFNTDDEDNKILINDLLDVLGKREREMIKMYYGMHPYNKELTLDEIGKIFKLTKERVRQIIEKSFTKIRSQALIIDNSYI